jgi:methylated-DNA-[protein]-cysteine S-methyltransferase
MHLRLEHWESPVATLLLVTDSDGILRALDFADYQDRMRRLLRGHYGEHTLEEGAAPASIRRALESYFDGNLDTLTDVKTATGGTSFQRKVWAGLRTIPFGATISYSELASRIDHPGSSRAVGAANGVNPIAIVVPCHRVIGANGSLTGYGGGLARKQWLLAHEARFTADCSGLESAATSSKGTHPFVNRCVPF